MNRVDSGTMHPYSIKPVDSTVYQRSLAHSYTVSILINLGKTSKTYSNNTLKR